MQGGERGGREACLCTSMLHDFMPLRVLFPVVPPFTSQPGKLLLMLQNLAQCPLLSEVSIGLQADPTLPL